MKSLLLGILICLTSISRADDLYVERTWTSTVGSSLLASFVSLPEGKLVELRDSTGKIHRIPRNSLSKQDSIFLARRTQSPAYRASIAPVETKIDPSLWAPPKGFKPLAKPDRLGIPIPNVDDGEGVQAVVLAFVSYSLWWDQEKVLEIPKQGDIEAKTEWICRRFDRYFKSRSSSASGIHDSPEAMKKYFEGDLAEFATHRMHIEPDVRPERLVHYTTGVNAAVLDGTLLVNDRPFQMGLCLISADLDGRLVFTTWGERFKGTLRVMKEDPEMINRRYGKVPATTYEIHLDNKPEANLRFPRWLKDQAVRLTIDPENSDGLMVLRPYVFAEKGAGLPAPPDPLFPKR